MAVPKRGVRDIVFFAAGDWLDHSAARAWPQAEQEMEVSLTFESTIWLSFTQPMMFGCEKWWP
jgi:hypothetical protein